MRRPTATYREHRRCLLCEQPIPDRHRGDYCCGHPVLPVEQVLVATHVRMSRKEILTLTRTRIMPGGWRRWAGYGEDRRLVIWDEA